MTLSDKIAQAIMTFEGYFQGSVSWQNHNPGNLKFRNQPNNLGKDNQGHAIFKTFEDGYDALLSLINGWYKGTSVSIYNPDMTLQQIFSKYAEGNSKEYADYVAFRLGVKPTTKLKDLK